MLSESLLKELEEYVEFFSEPLILESKIHMETDAIRLGDYIEKKREPALSEVLFGMIDERGVKDSMVYKKAGIDRRHFSKIRSNPGYQARKRTVIALALALELNRDEMDRLLESAGYSLSSSDTYDLVGANIDVFKEAGNLGIRKENAFSYEVSEDGIKTMYEEVSMLVSDRRSDRS